MPPVLLDSVFPYRIFPASWPSSPAMAASVTASSPSTLPTRIRDCGESIWFVNRPPLPTCYMLFKKNGEKSLAYNSHFKTSFLLTSLVIGFDSDVSI